MILSPALQPLAAYPQFITYRLQPRPGVAGKMDKVPCNPQTGETHSAHDRSIWTTAEEAAALAILADRGHGSWIGFVLADSDPFWCVDIDDCRDGASWNALAGQICADLSGAAIEVSQSGRGLHVFGQGVVPPHRSKNVPLHLELYTSNQFIALSRNQATGNAAVDLSASMTALVEKYFTPSQALQGATFDDWTSEPCPEWGGPMDDDTLIAKAKRSASKVPGSVKFKELYERDVEKIAAKWPDTNGRDFDESSADMALAMHLAFWTGRDCERMERLMRESGLYRDKYERRDYMIGTILKACSGGGDVLSERVYPTPEEAFGGKPADFVAALENASDVPVPPPPADEYVQRVYHLDKHQSESKTNHLNIERWIAGTGLRIRKDLFANIVRVGSKALDDDIERTIWLAIREKSGLEFAWDLFGHTLRGMATANEYDPLKNYLAAAQAKWDGTSRLDTWLTKYLGVERSAYSEAIGALFLTAAVRRARKPGEKFDEMMVLEGPQGIEKSTAIQSLSPDPSWFCDDVHVGMKSKELLEVTAGKWLVEAPELSRMNDSEVEHIKAMLSRQVDRARLAYARNSTERGRQWVAFATTNKDRYMRDATGNRRLWPVRVTRVDVAGIVRDREQLWAEAAVREATGVSIRLDRSLWADAAVEQQARIVEDPFEDVLSAALGNLEGRVASDLLWDILSIPVERRQKNVRAMGDAMHKLGWTHKRLRADGTRAGFYVKGDSDVEIQFNEQRVLAPKFTVITGGRV